MMYELVESEVTIENRTYQTFGMSWEEIIIKDITTEREEAEQLIKECNDNELDPIHLNEFVESFLLK